MLGQMGKHLGLEEKADNELMAQFVIEKQLKELQDALGISLTSSVFASNRKQDIEKIADDALEYIIESYSGIVNELKTIVSNAQTVQVQTAQQINTQFQQVDEPVNNVVETPVINVEQPNVDNSTADNSDEDEIIDFGNADFSALGSFFGEQ